MRLTLAGLLLLGGCAGPAAPGGPLSLGSAPEPDGGVAGPAAAGLHREPWSAGPAGVGAAGVGGPGAGAAGADPATDAGGRSEGSASFTTGGG